MHEVLVNRLGGLSLPRKSVVRLTDRPDMTLDVYRGRKTTKQQQQQNQPTLTGRAMFKVLFTDKTVTTLLRLFLEEQSDQGLHCLSFYCFIYTSYCNENPNCSILG